MSMITYQLWGWVASLLSVFPLEHSDGGKEVELWGTASAKLAELSC